MRRPGIRLSTRIALWVTVLVPLLVTAFGLLLLPLVNRDLHHQEDAALTDRAAAVLPSVRTLLAADRRGKPKAEQNQQRKVINDALDSGVRVASQDGEVLVAMGPQPGDAVRLPTRAGGPVTVRGGGRVWRVLTVRIDGAAPGTLWLVVPSNSDDPQLAAVRRRVLLIALASAPVSGAIALAVAERGTASLRRLSRRAAALDPGAGAAAFAHGRTGTAEVDELASAIGLVLSRYDDQAARTAQALDTARSFSSAASHELRTPLMSMRTNLDVLAGHPELPRGERAEVVQELQQDHARLLELLTALHTLARGDLVDVSAFSSTDLAELVDAEVADAGRRRANAVIRTELPSRLRVFGWEAGLRIMLANLLANASLHGRGSDGAADILVRLRATDGWAELTVDDAGPGIPAADRAAVFHRFHRRQDSPGSGLGLTLVAQQAALHRGTVSIDDGPGGRGCRFTVRLPLPGAGGADGPGAGLPARRDWLSG
ncbi:HAMP domain-containing sensor histidine kinase [Kitasatospora sp. NPDC049258]|uniref:sensor histidine kinase n=1 Tax=Kitasatospora sp. NPDC049258 TaxID=3155394 RepID=UPI00342D4526